VDTKIRKKEGKKRKENSHLVLGHRDRMGGVGGGHDGHQLLASKKEKQT
jgi:hypothetical protein